MSVERLSEHRRIWAEKPVLAEIYAVWFRQMLAGVPRNRVVLEVGAGPGLLTEWARALRPDLRWVATDLLAAPWNDVVADASRLPLRSSSVDHVVALDVLHHLADPQAFFAEAARVTRAGGSVVMIEPWVTPWSYPIYRFAHQEGCTLAIDPRHPFRTGAEKDAFEGDGALPWKIVRSTPPGEWAERGLSAPRVHPCNGFAYLLSLGFKKASLLPRSAAGLALAVDRALAPLSRWTGMRALIVWERPD
ncbi:MAG: class I SAM-dependent methyltransferase [Vicinamibacteria bacterium]